MKLRSQMMILVCGALAPLLIVAAIGGASLVRHERETLERGVVGMTRAAMTAVDAELRGVISALTALAASQNLGEGDIKAFHDECRRLMHRQSRWLDVSLADGEGRRIFDARSPYGVVHEGEPAGESVERALRGARAAVGNLVYLANGLEPGPPSVRVSYPVVRGDKTVFVLTAYVEPHLFSDVLRAQRLPDDWVIALADRNRRFVARLPPRPPGDPISPSFQAALASAPEGFFPGTTVEGQSVYTPYVTSPVSEWVLGIAMPSSAVYAGATRLAGTIAAGVLLALAVALALAWLLARHMARPIALLAAAGQSLRRGEDVALRPSGHVDEIVQLQAAMLDGFAAARERQAVIERQVARLELLDQITSAIAEHQDLRSIYQVVVRSVEERLPLDFACVCRHDPRQGTLTVMHVGVRSEPLATALAMTEEGCIAVDDNGMSRCIHGEFVEEPDTAALPHPFARRLAEGGLRSLVLSPLVVDGQVLSVLVAARAMPNAFGAGECEFLRQLSAHTALAVRQSRLNHSLAQAYDELRQTQQAVLQQERLRSLGQMASGIAHDINNAILPAMLYTEGLLESEKGLSTSGRQQLEVVLRAIDDVAATVARMGEFYRQHGRQMPFAPLSLNRLAQQVGELTRARWSDMPQQRGLVVNLRTELEADLPDVSGVENEIREALINLVFNAVDAMPSGGDLVIRTRRLPPREGEGTDSVCIEVADTGVGMDEETRKRCLEPFFTTKGERGTGLGLAMIYGIAQRHHATIDIESEVGRGTTIGLRFAGCPRPVAAAAAPSQVAYRTAATGQPKARVLVLDDDPLVLQTLMAMLQSGGDDVVAADGGKAGIDAFVAAQAGGAPFDIVFTDLGMPHVDGHTVAARIKQVSPSTPVVLLTGWGQSGPDGKRPENVDLVMSKPPKLREIREVLARFARPAPAGNPRDTG